MCKQPIVMGARSKVQGASGERASDDRFRARNFNGKHEDSFLPPTNPPCQSSLDCCKKNIAIPFVVKQKFRIFVKKNRLEYEKSTDAYACRNADGCMWR